MKIHTNKMRPAFTLIELIFVIVIVAVLAAAARMAMPDNALHSDTKFVVQQIRKTQMEALMVDHYDFDDASWRDRSYDDTCIQLSKSALQARENNTTDPRRYHLHPKTTLTVDPDDATLCFDALGRPYRQDYRLNHFLKKPIKIEIHYKDKKKSVVIMPYSGSVIVTR